MHACARIFGKVIGNRGGAGEENAAIVERIGQNDRIGMDGVMT